MTLTHRPKLHRCLCASIFARQRGIPRIYVGCNSGARFGLSDAVRKVFRIQWNDPYDFGRGIKYLWLTDKDVEALGPAVVTERVKVDHPPGAVCMFTSATSRY